MTLQELRINDYVLLGDKIEKIDSEFFTYILQGMYEVFPITITNEWSKRFGFGEYGQNTVKGYKLERYYDDTFALIHADNYDEVIVLCEYVHELQNIWYDLTGDELK